jgi:curli biogenesis system outer membrane secretion channel CsgG
MKLKILMLALISAGAINVNAQSFLDDVKKNFEMKPGGANAPVTGSAGAEGAKNEAPTLEKCEAPLGTIAISEPQSEIAAALQQYKLPPPTQLLRLMIQQSNCFQVVERGAAMKNILQERALAQSGEMQQGQNIGKGQLVAADFLMTANVTFTNNNAGGVGGGLGGLGALFGPIGMIAGAVAAGVQFKEAQTTLIVADARSGLQVAAAEGSVSKSDFGIGGVIGNVGAGAYSNTAEGKIVAAALLDNYNNIVKTVRSLPSLTQATSSSASARNASNSVQAGAFRSGDVLSPKISGVSLLGSPLKTSKVLGKLPKNDEVLHLGEEKDGYAKVKSGNLGDGWVELMMMKKN